MSVQISAPAQAALPLHTHRDPTRSRTSPQVPVPGRERNNVWVLLEGCDRGMENPK